MYQFMYIRRVILKKELKKKSYSKKLKKLFRELISIISLNGVPHVNVIIITTTEH